MREKCECFPARPTLPLPHFSLDLLCDFINPLKTAQLLHLFEWDIPPAIHQRSIILDIFVRTDTLEKASNPEERARRSKSTNYTSNLCHQSSTKLGKFVGPFAVLGKLHPRAFNFYKRVTHEHPTTIK